jgi:hypothetical protein
MGSRVITERPGTMHCEVYAIVIGVIGVSFAVIVDDWRSYPFSLKDFDCVIIVRVLRLNIIQKQN